MEAPAEQDLQEPSQFWQIKLLEYFPSGHESKQEEPSKDFAAWQVKQFVEEDEHVKQGELQVWQAVPSENFPRGQEAMQVKSFKRLGNWQLKQWDCDTEQVKQDPLQF